MSDDSMQYFMDVINGGYGRTPKSTSPVERETSFEDDGTAQMKKILEGFRGVTQDAVKEAQNVVNTMRGDSSIETTKTDYHHQETNSVVDYYSSPVTSAPKMENYSPNSFEVRSYLVEGSNVRKEYDVVERYSSNTIVGKLVIKEAADAIVKYLQKGYPIQHEKINEILDHEEKYRRNRQDAVTFKQRYEKSTEAGEHSSAGVYESRFQVAKANAIMASDHIKSILANIRL
ncbi:hypothetical protein FDI40_gp045 [Agrobacterium phage Atu_ph07]|uniref:Uncharacterized protein n=1 Tax=Agrobacterium phage Atu_ph07 TaxID=2024264 RepID=A0A2L0UZ98_9CAUD|nr:hypothetical protein FDI40_gp045 [Agrobacterium phage Atu_ph07]AUZ94857.1 hypothetical protein [Agrobacterium phage Atu_ph07]